MKRIRDLLFLPYQKKKLFIQSYFLIWLIRLGLWIISYNFLINCLNLLGSSKSVDEKINWQVVREISYAVKTFAKYVPSASCLTQALATQTLLNLRGQKSKLKFGVDKDESEKLIAHAWIEIEGKIIVGGAPDIRRYKVLTSNVERFVV